MPIEGAMFVVRSVETGVRPVRLRLPFRFGAITLNACPQLFVRAVVEVAGHGSASGFAAEMMVPKWFDKRAGFSHAQNIGDLADAITRTALAYVNDSPATPFGLFARHYPTLMQAGRQAGATELSSAYGQAVIDRAVLDAVCRALKVSFFDAARHNLIGVSDSAVIADMHGFDWSQWLPTLAPLNRIEARHTIGLLDELQQQRFGDDGLPVSLPAVIAHYGLTVFKIKLGGEPAADALRLAEVLEVLDRHAPGHHYTLDGNEQYASADALVELFARIRALPAFARRPEALLYIEQPLPRELSLSSPLPAEAAPAPLLMDEADGTLRSFVAGVALGWRGVSSKACKGLYKSIVNRARCEHWNGGGAPRFFMSAEDLTCQAGLAVQQDLALLALLGLSHSERNGHHYSDGFGSAPMAEQQAFAAAHPDLYDNERRRPRLRIENGAIRIDSLFAPGYGHSGEIDWRDMQPLASAAAML